jgi:ElaB/YqjD/DUF883 family membrane-anchored ribosome-binding protein
MVKREPDIEGLKENLVELKDRIEEIENSFGQKVKEKAMQAERKVENTIGEKPIQSVGMAFGAGMVAGMIASAMMRR